MTRKHLNILAQWAKTEKDNLFPENDRDGQIAFLRAIRDLAFDMCDSKERFDERKFNSSSGLYDLLSKREQSVNKFTE